MADHTTQCPECAGLGRVLDRGTLVPCEECEGEGLVEAVLAYPFAAYVDPDWKGEPDLLPIPRRERDAE